MLVAIKTLPTDPYPNCLVIYLLWSNVSTSQKKKSDHFLQPKMVTNAGPVKMPLQHIASMAKVASARKEAWEDGGVWMFIL